MRRATPPWMHRRGIAARWRSRRICGAVSFDPAVGRPDWRSPSDITTQNDEALFPTRCPQSAQEIGSAVGALA